jgi:hypothetical protein
MVASDGERAWRNAITLIAQCERLLSRDTPTVRRTDEDLTIDITRRLKENRRRQSDYAQFQEIGGRNED